KKVDAVAGRVLKSKGKRGFRDLQRIARAARPRESADPARAVGWAKARGSVSRVGKIVHAPCPRGDGAASDFAHPTAEDEALIEWPHDAVARANRFSIVRAATVPLAIAVAMHGCAGSETSPTAHTPRQEGPMLLSTTR